jgi:apolipoprotein N-acyltransferase
MLLAFLSGLLMGLSPAPGNAWGLAWIALAPLWVLVHQSQGNWRRSLFLGFCWGVGYHGLAISWITGLHPLTWMGVSWLNSVLITLTCWVLITLWGAAISATWAGLFSMLLVFLAPQKAELFLDKEEKPETPVGIFNLKFSDRRAIPLSSISLSLLSGITLWCLLEWLWGQSFLWWTSLSYTQSPSNLAILHLGQLSGPTTVTAALVGVNGLLAYAWLAGSQRAGRNYQRIYGLAAIAIMLLCHLLGWYLYSRPLVEVPDQSLKVGIIQGNVPTRIKLFPEGVRQALEGYTQGYLKLVDQGVQAVLTPEAAIPLVLTEETLAQTAFAQAVSDRQVIAWLGGFGRQGNQVTQSLFTLDETGKIYSRYNKIKLVPLGEYIPFQETLGSFIGRLSPNKSDLTPGRFDQQFDTPWGRAIAGICFDSAFTQLFRNQAAAGGEFILTAANNDPYSSVMMAQHHAQDVMRAIESDRWAVRATNTGYSGVVDPHGETRWRSSVKTYELHAHTIYRRQTQTLYVRWGDWLLPTLVLMTATAIILNRLVGQRTERY